MQLSDVKADLCHVMAVIGLLHEIALEMDPCDAEGPRRAQIDNMQAVFAVLRPFAQNFQKDLERFPDQLESVV
jgi:hypothetical protein